MYIQREVSRVVEGEVHVSSPSTPNTSAADAACRADGSRGADASFPSAFRDVDRSTAGCSLECEESRSRLARCARWRAATLGDGSCNAAANSEFCYVLIVEDNVADIYGQ